MSTDPAALRHRSSVKGMVKMPRMFRDTVRNSARTVFPRLIPVITTPDDSVCRRYCGDNDHTHGQVLGKAEQTGCDDAQYGR